MEFSSKISDILEKDFNIPVQTKVASAHKVPEKVVEIIKELNKDPQPQVVITIVGMSNGLAGVAAASLIHPVINCPPFKDTTEYYIDIHSSLRMPSEVPVMTVLNPKNAAVCAARILSEGNETLKAKIKERIDNIKAGY